MLINNEIDIAFTTTKPNNNDIEIIEWIDDEIVFFSNKPLPATMEFDDLLKYEFVCREDASILKQEISKTLKKHNKDCSNFNITSYVNNSTALKFTILNSHNQLVSIISKNAIKHEIESKKLFITTLKDIKLKRKIYMSILKNNNKGDIITKYLKNNI
jgi:DNA-binding transcriptional LysR family regulator